MGLAACIPWENRGKRFEEALQALKTIWTTDPVEFEGEFFSIPRSFIGPKPVQKPYPPIYLGAFSPAAAARTARYADGWLAVAYPTEEIAKMFSAIQALAEVAGRDPAELELLVGGNVELADQPLGDERMTFMGTTEQVAADISATRDIGASELIMDATFDPGVHSVEDFLGRMELLFRLAEQSLAAVPA
jgi:alkanesulfonate monooxygenase SsuD/methylene tetrahydromethanopterin reductase-like flavin-dependent oxidoreductase (luciferase family)